MPKLFVLSCLLLFVSCGYANAQTENVNLIIEAAIENGNGGYSFTVFNQKGKEIFEKQVGAVYSNALSWIFILDTATQLRSVFNSKGNSLRIKDVQDSRNCYISCNRVAIKQNGKWGFYDSKGKKKIDNLYDEVSDFSGNINFVRIGDASFFIDTNGVKVLPPENVNMMLYDFTERNFASGITNFMNRPHKVVEKDGKKGLIDSVGTLIIPYEYEGFHNLNEKFKLVIVKKDNKYGVVSFNNEIIIPILYDNFFILNEPWNR